jgi:hypothetical protein
LQVGDTGPVESARRSNSRVLGSPFSGLSGHQFLVFQTEDDLVANFAARWQAEQGADDAGCM